MKRIGVILLIVCFLMGITLPIHGQENASQIVISDKAEISIENLLDTTSLKASFLIESEAFDPIDVQFDFNTEIQSEITEYRYHKDSGILSIYLSGLFPLPSSLGTIVFKNDPNLKHVRITALTNEFQAVNVALEDRGNEFVASAEGVEISFDETSQETQPEKDPEDDTQETDPENDRNDGQASPNDPETSFPEDDSNHIDQMDPEADLQNDKDIEKAEGTHTSVQNGIHVFGALMFSSLSCILFVFIVKFIKKARV